MTVINHEHITQRTAEKLEQVMQTLSTAILTACFGKLCNQHAKCARWHAVDNAPANQKRIAFCIDSDGSRPLFVAVAA